MSPAEPAPDADAVADALRHVLMDAFSLHLLALCAAWNVEQPASVRYRRMFRERARAALGAAERVGALLRRRGAPVALHPTDPPELPRWMFAAPLPQPDMLVGLLAQATAEFVSTVEAALEVAQGGDEDDFTRRSLARRLAAERKRERELRTLAAALTARPPQLHS